MKAQDQKRFDGRMDSALSNLNWEAQIYYEVPAAERGEKPAWLRVLPLLNMLPYMRPVKDDVSPARRTTAEAWEQAGGPDLRNWNLADMPVLDRVALMILRAWQQHFDGSAAWEIRFDQAEDAYRAHCQAVSAAKIAAYQAKQLRESLAGVDPAATAAEILRRQAEGQAA